MSIASLQCQCQHLTLPHHAEAKQGSHGNQFFASLATETCRPTATEPPTPAVVAPAELSESSGILLFQVPMYNVPLGNQNHQ